MHLLDWNLILKWIPHPHLGRTLELIKINKTKLSTELGLYMYIVQWSMKCVLENAITFLQTCICPGITCEHQPSGIQQNSTIFTILEIWGSIVLYASIVFFVQECHRKGVLPPNEMCLQWGEFFKSASYSWVLLLYMSIVWHVQNKQVFSQGHHAPGQIALCHLCAHFLPQKEKNRFKEICKLKCSSSHMNVS